MTTTTEPLLLRPKSEEIYKRSCRVIPSGVSSPVRAFSGLEQTPLVVESGYGDKIVDADGFSYVDYCCSWGALLHGHAPSCIVEAVQRRAAMGSSFGITTAIEARLAEMIVESVPSVEKVRFVSSGTEATMSAARVARGYTNRDLIIKFAGNYHGHADAFLVQAGSGLVNLTPTSSSGGVPQAFVQHTLCLPYNDIGACRKIFQERRDRIAAVILEPIAANMGVIQPSIEFVQMLREETKKVGALLIFDEVITGFRVALGGAQDLFDVEADLSCFGKIIGGGFPAAAFGGRSEIMDCLAPTGSVYQAGTLSGNPVAMEAGYQTLRLCSNSDFYQKLEEKTVLIIEPVRELIEKKSLDMCVHQVGSMFTLFFGKREINNLDDVKECDLERFSRFFQTLFHKGIYLSPSQFEANFVSSAHTLESIVYTRDCILEILNRI